MRRPRNLERNLIPAGAVEPGDWIAPFGEWRCVSAVELDGREVVMRFLDADEPIRRPRMSSIYVWRGARHAANHA